MAFSTVGSDLVIVHICTNLFMHFLSMSQKNNQFAFCVENISVVFDSMLHEWIPYHFLHSLCKCVGHSPLTMCKGAPNVLLSFILYCHISCHAWKYIFRNINTNRRWLTSQLSFHPCKNKSCLFNLFVILLKKHNFEVAFAVTFVVEENKSCQTNLLCPN